MPSTAPATYIAIRIIATGVDVTAFRRGGEQLIFPNARQSP